MIEDEDLWVERLEKSKANFLADETICRENRELFSRFFEFQERKLKRINGLPALDNGASKTLLAYVARLRNTNKWFENKPLEELTKEDIQRVYDGLEDGKILTQQGQRFESRNDYYNKVFKSKLFELAGKKELARSVIEFSAPQKIIVRFVTEKEFRKIEEQTTNPNHRLLLWLAFDIGENINALLKLQRSDFTKEINPASGEPEYRVQLRREILKRSRRPRSEITNYSETARLLEEVLPELQADEELFKFDYPYSKKILNRLLKRSGAKCDPANDKITWKDLRSGMACDLLRKGWTTDEVNARLGHKPSSDEIDKYVNFLALDRHRPKQKAAQYQLETVRQELVQSQQREQLHLRRIETLEQSLSNLREDLKAVVQELRQTNLQKLGETITTARDNSKSEVKAA